jgi:beta-glucuronidase
MLCCFGFASAAEPLRVDLNSSWRFRADREGAGEASGWNRQVPQETQLVSVPHTWNMGALHDYLGVAWYFKEFEAPNAPHVQLHFGATFYKARVWLNGVEVGTHEGGFTAYSFDITRLLHKKNLLVVRLDNRPGVDTIPGFAERGEPRARYDWWTYGGIVRDVWLTSTGPAWIRRQSIRAEMRGTEAVISDKLSLASSQAKPEAVTLRTEILDAENRPIRSDTRSIMPSATQEVSLTLPLPAPRLWSLNQPYLYRLKAELTDKQGSTLDSNVASFGVRTFEIRDRHLLLNGTRVRLTGMTRHEDSPWEGLAETRGTILHDYDDMKSLHTNLTRPVHYPQHPLILDYADQHGIVLIPEIPIWQFSEAQLSDPKVIALAKQQVREMIEEAGNHPSIFGWSVANESAMGTPGGVAYFRALRDYVREVDPGRPVTFADDNLYKLDRREQSAAADADFILMNQYFGSWHGPAEALVPALDKVNQLFPDKMVIISEMGFAGIFAKDPKSADEARVNIIRTQMPVLAARDWIGGAILWCYQDYKSPRNLWPGETSGLVDHGLVDADRQKRPSYAAWEEANRPASLKLQSTAAGVSLTVVANTAANLPFVPLNDYKLTWVATDEKGVLAGNGERQLGSEATVTLTANLPPGASKLTVRGRLLDPYGHTAADVTTHWPP